MPSEEEGRGAVGVGVGRDRLDSIDKNFDGVRNIGMSDDAFDGILARVARSVLRLVMLDGRFPGHMFAFKCVFSRRAFLRNKLTPQKECP
jgi:hypothetical protein